MNYLYFVARMLPVIAVTLIPLGIWRIIRWKRETRAGRKVSAVRESALMFFFAYLAGLASLTFESYRGFTLPELSRINLRPFRMAGDLFNHGRFDLTTYQAVLVVSNIAVFIPIGFLAAFLWRRFRKPLFAILLGGGISLAIEISQAFCGRRTDIDDILLNTLGAVLGWAAYAVVTKLSKRIKHETDIRKSRTRSL